MANQMPAEMREQAERLRLAAGRSAENMQEAFAIFSAAIEREGQDHD